MVCKIDIVVVTFRTTRQWLRHYIFSLIPFGFIRLPAYTSHSPKIEFHYSTDGYSRRSARGISWDAFFFLVIISEKYPFALVRIRGSQSAIKARSIKVPFYIPVSIISTTLHSGRRGKMQPRSAPPEYHLYIRKMFNVIYRRFHGECS